MKIPDDAVIPVEKLTKYLLVLCPWDDKSRFLAQAGFDQSNPDVLMAASSPGNRGRGERGWKQRVWDLLPARGEPGRPRRAIAGRRDGLDPLACRRIVSLCDPETLEEPTPMKPELYQRVALRRDVTDHRLMRGDVAVLVDRVPHPSGGEPGVVLEIFNAIGESLSVVAVKESDIEPLRADEVLTVRSLAAAG